MKSRLALVLTGLLFAAAAQAAPTPPDVVVKGTTEKLQALIQQNLAKYQADQALFYKVVDETVVPHFDTRYIAQLVLARHWRGATDAQRSRFETAFKSMLIGTYANTLLEYHDSVRADWKPLRIADGATEATVNSSLMRPNGPPIPVGFVMRLNNGAWKIYDITIENISLIANFRGQFNGEIRKSGLDAVIKSMEDGTYLRRTPPSTAKQG